MYLGLESESQWIKKKKRFTCILTGNRVAWLNLIVTKFLYSSGNIDAEQKTCGRKRKAVSTSAGPSKKQKTTLNLNALDMTCIHPESYTAAERYRLCDLIDFQRLV